MNSDASIRRSKGQNRPVNCFENRKRMLLAIRCVSRVVEFDTEAELEQIILDLRPNWLVTGPPHIAPGHKEALLAEWGGEVIRMAGKVDSTTDIIERMR
jgi:D-beta-D-heptose 7-phosphate kinase/D-beta-D-heptose 1-phosphate adenosyltransferase